MTRAACAICLRPLVSMANCVLVGTEVAHRGCAQAGGLTELWRTRRALAESQEECQRYKNVAAEAARIAMRAATQVAEAGAAMARIERDRARLLRASEAVTSQSGRDEELTRERDAARAEVAALRAQRPPPPPAVTATATPDSTPVEDATVLRFSLLDLD